MEKKKEEKKVEAKPKNDADAVLDAVKELTKTVADLASKINTMEKTHAKWVRAGKF